jgi:hypothetical protein
VAADLPLQATLDRGIVTIPVLVEYLQDYGELTTALLDAGKEYAPGIRQIDLGKFPINIGGYKTAMVIDFAAKPGSAFPDSVMPNDMVCVIVTGEYLVKQSGPGAADHEFTVKAGGVYSCAKDSHETAKNTGSVQAVMRRYADAGLIVCFSFNRPASGRWRASACQQRCLGALDCQDRAQATVDPALGFAAKWSMSAHGTLRHCQPVPVCPPFGGFTDEPGIAAGGPSLTHCGSRPA